MTNPPRGSAAYLAQRRPTHVALVETPPDPACIVTPYVDAGADLLAVVRLSGDLRAEAGRLAPLEHGTTKATMARALQIVTNVEVLAARLRAKLEAMA